MYNRSLSTLWIYTLCAMQAIEATKNFSPADWRKKFAIEFSGEEGTAENKLAALISTHWLYLQG